MAYLFNYISLHKNMRIKNKKLIRPTSILKVSGLSKEKDSIEMLSALLIGSDDGIITEDLNGCITSWNRSAEEIFGYTSNEMIGKSIDFLFPPSQFKNGRLSVDENLQVIDKSHFIAEHICKNGTRITVLNNAFPILNSNAEVIGTSIITKDISKQKKNQLALVEANNELSFQSNEIDKNAEDLVIANREKAKRVDELVIANEELLFQNKEKAKRAAELVIANREKVQRVDELVIANEELLFQNQEKAKRAAELVIANEELLFQNQEKAKRAAELVIANEELLFQNKEKAKRAAELVIANEEKAKRVNELVIANEEKAKRVDELVIANEELLFQNEEKLKRASELVIANEEKAKRVNELVIANEELLFQNEEKAKRAAELVIADEEKDKLEAVNNKKLHLSLMETIGIARELVEMRDPYTAGHEQHVGDLAKAIGQEMGLDDHCQEGLMIAGYLHDIGKIIIPEAILCKPGRISVEEYNLIKNHVQAGYDLLKNVNFPWDISRSVLEHHERLDGSGYPNGLKGSQTSLEGRIMGVADVVDAMSAFRPYRAALGVEVALEELERGRGSIFDEKVVDACLRLFRKKAYKIVTTLH
jgi:PAS domain S-box-containing protein/putative nucleotidyltransferase with HDIG domain